MRTRTKWIVAGGAAAFVLTPVAAVVGSTTLDSHLQQGGLVIDARASQQKAGTVTARDKAAAPSAEPTTEPSGKKTVSAATPISPTTSATPKTPVSPKTPAPKKTTKTWTDDSPQSPDTAD